MTYLCAHAHGHYVSCLHRERIRRRCTAFLHALASRSPSVPPKRHRRQIEHVRHYLRQVASPAQDVIGRYCCSKGGCHRITRRENVAPSKIGGRVIGTLQVLQRRLKYKRGQQKGMPKGASRAWLRCEGQSASKCRERQERGKTCTKYPKTSQTLRGKEAKKATNQRKIYNDLPQPT